MTPSREKPRDQLPDEWPRSVISDSPSGLRDAAPFRPRRAPPIAWFMLGLLALVVLVLAIATLRLSPRPPAKTNPAAAATVLTPLTQPPPRQ